MTPLKTAARTRQVSATPSVTTERPWFAAADGFHVNERACALVSRKLQPLGSPFAAGMTGLLFNRRLLWVDSASSARKRGTTATAAHQSYTGRAQISEQRFKRAYEVYRISINPQKFT